jgi:hypothetical protein
VNADESIQDELIAIRAKSLHRFDDENAAVAHT